MCDEVRTVHSLSGGESFLVSLALALGLSSLSSNRMRVESLFIDEGFGSLDAETLRVAMDALESLRTQGRKIGVISHVQEMTERIPVRICVNRAGNGRSFLEVLVKFQNPLSPRLDAGPQKNRLYKVRFSCDPASSARIGLSPLHIFDNNPKADVHRSLPRQVGFTDGRCGVFRTFTPRAATYDFLFGQSLCLPFLLKDKECNRRPSIPPRFRSCRTIPRDWGGKRRRGH